MAVKIVLTTTNNQEEAERIGNKLVEEKLSACVNIVSEIKSIYRWKDEVEKDKEALLIIKTNQKNMNNIKSRIKELHSYENPEMLVIPIEDGLPEYLKWVEKNCQKE